LPTALFSSPDLLGFVLLLLPCHGCFMIDASALYVSLSVTRVLLSVQTQKGVCFLGRLFPRASLQRAPGAKQPHLAPPPRRNQSPLVSSVASAPPRARQPRRGEGWTGPPLSRTKTLGGAITHRAARAPAGSLPTLARTRTTRSEAGAVANPAAAHPPLKRLGRGGKGGRAPQRGAKGGEGTRTKGARARRLGGAAAAFARRHRAHVRRPSVVPVVAATARGADG